LEFKLDLDDSTVLTAITIITTTTIIIIIIIIVRLHTTYIQNFNKSNQNIVVNIVRGKSK
jgi:hypothetical protein